MNTDIRAVILTTTVDDDQAAEVRGDPCSRAKRGLVLIQPAVQIVTQRLTRFESCRAQPVQPFAIFAQSPGLAVAVQVPLSDLEIPAFDSLRQEQAIAPPELFHRPSSLAQCLRDMAPLSRHLAGQAANGGRHRAPDMRARLTFTPTG